MGDLSGPGFVDTDGEAETRLGKAHCWLCHPYSGAILVIYTAVGFFIIFAMSITIVSFLRGILTGNP